jgi:hypothetical protein
LSQNIPPKCRETSPFFPHDGGRTYLFYSEDGSRTFLRKTNEYQPGYTIRGAGTDVIVYNLYMPSYIQSEYIII